MQNLTPKEYNEVLKHLENHFNIVFETSLKYTDKDSIINTGIYLQEVAILIRRVKDILLMK